MASTNQRGALHGCLPSFGILVDALVVEVLQGTEPGVFIGRYRRRSHLVLNFRAFTAYFWHGVGVELVFPGLWVRFGPLLQKTIRVVCRGHVVAEYVTNSPGDGNSIPEPECSRLIDTTIEIL